MIKMFLSCRKWSQEFVKVIPWGGGWEDWDLHEMKYFEWLEEAVEDIKADNERREKAKEASKTFFSGT